ncbi:PucR family transcriptional regulator [Streptomyces sp. NPDC090106]|uniref:PucR family transcriptional regulator n=1 Tax=Streptomyces sp. NPDC090106 TaxID=3365946 RepID=UPI0037F80489
MNETAPPGFPEPPASVGAVARRIGDLLGVGLSWCGPGEDEIGDVVIVEPGDTAHDVSGALVLAVGAREDDAVGMVRDLRAAAAVAVRVPETGVPAALRTAASAYGVAVLGIPAGVRWDRVEAEVRAALVRGREPERGDDLYSLAQTVALLTHGVVSVEDAAYRVVAYAGPGDQADELRRLSVLGRSCPEPYLTLLRRLGVYQRVRESDEVIAVDPRPELGARRRLVIGINAGRRPLGTVWVQEGDRPLAEGSAEILRGAARLAAAQLVDHYFQGDSTARLASREELSHGLLTGRFDSAALAAHLGIDPAAAARVVAVDLRLPDAAGTGDAARADARRAEAAGVMSVHAAAFRDNALVVQACGQLYAVLPEAAGGAGTVGGGSDEDERLVRWTESLTVTLRRLTGTPVQAVVAGRADRLAAIPAVKLRGHRALTLLARTPEVTVGTHTRLTPALFVRDALELLGRAGDAVRFPAIASLVARDREQGTEMARSLLLYLDAFGDVATVAKRLNVHPNTLRYRVRRAVALTGLDLDDPEHRLAATLQLRLDLEGPGWTDTAFPTV